MAGEGKALVSMKNEIDSCHNERANLEKEIMTLTEEKEDCKATNKDLQGSTLTCRVWWCDCSL